MYEGTSMRIMYKGCKRDAKFKGCTKLGNFSFKLTFTHILLNNSMFLLICVVCGMYILSRFFIHNEMFIIIVKYLSFRS